MTKSFFILVMLIIGVTNTHASVTSQLDLNDQLKGQNKPYRDFIAIWRYAAYKIGIAGECSNYQMREPNLPNVTLLFDPEMIRPVVTKMFAYLRNAEKFAKIKSINHPLSKDLFLVEVWKANQVAKKFINNAHLSTSEKYFKCQETTLDNIIYFMEK